MAENNESTSAIIKIDVSNNKNQCETNQTASIAPHGLLKDDYYSTINESNNLKILLDEFDEYRYKYPMTLFNEKYYPLFIKINDKYELELCKLHEYNEYIIYTKKFSIKNIDYNTNLISLLNNLENDYCIYNNQLKLKRIINILNEFTKNH
uniref:Uncharacterized protein n=1 Tax=viral metagenome TaxID=1070528 RepID=A0A6C0H600_9ZZZZ